MPEGLTEFCRRQDFGFDFRGWLSSIDARHDKTDLQLPVERVFDEANGWKVRICALPLSERIQRRAIPHGTGYVTLDVESPGFQWLGRDFAPTAHFQRKEPTAR